MDINTGIKQVLYPIYDFFPKTLSFWSVLFYIFMLYFFAYIIFHIYIYLYDLEYEIDCVRNDRCFKINKKGENNDSSNDSHKDSR